MPDHPDMICPLFEIPDYSDLVKKLESEGIRLTRPKPWKHTAFMESMVKNFGQGWADEADRGFKNDPVSIIIAMDGDEIIGFAAYEATARCYFGPTGVLESYRGRGIGKALFFKAMEGLRDMGYVYGIIGSPGPVDFYSKAMKGLLLPNDWKNIYTE